MATLYSRLQALGFPAEYVRDRILPDWWDDSLAFDPGARRLAELAIARTLGIPLESLADDDAGPLALAGLGEVRFKHWRAVEHDHLRPAVAVARRACELLLSSTKHLPAFRLEGVEPSALRERLLAQNQYITLSLLVSTAWDFGVPVVHLASLPTGSKRVDGMAFLVNGRPCIALASGKKSPAWLLWHLAHELGHVAKGHLRTGDALDVAIDLTSTEGEEREANLFAIDLIYGESNRGGFSAAQHITGERLAMAAKNLGPEHRIYPPCIVTNYGFNMKAWGTVNKALAVLGVNSGGPETIRAKSEERVDFESLADTDRHFFARVTGTAE